jgi:glutaredoxin 3
MTTRHDIEVFSAGCPVCEDTIAMINRLASGSGKINILDMNNPAVAKRAKALGVRSVPAVAIDGRLADCCASRGVDEATLRATLCR